MSDIVAKKPHCPACAADLRPKGFGSDRKCAFTEDGAFTPENWNCATIEALLILQEGELLGLDESGEIIPVRDKYKETNGWIILSRYKSRGCTSSAVHVGDFYPPKPLTYDLAVAVITGKYERGDED